MSDNLSMVEAICEGILKADPLKKERILYGITDLFVSKSSSLANDHIKLFDELIKKILTNIEIRPRLYIAEKISRLDQAPHDVLMDLACDKHISVARPVLLYSNCLTSEDLLEVIRRVGQEHLLTLAKRPALDDAVTDALIHIGEREVLRTVLENRSAKFSENGFFEITRKMSADPRLRLILMAREDTPEKIAHTIKTTIAHTREKPATPLIDDVYDEEMRNLIKNNRIPELISKLSEATEITEDVIKSAYTNPQHDTLLLIVKMAKLSWRTFEQVLTTKYGKTMSEVAHKKAMETFDRMTPSKAAMVLKCTAAA